MSIRLASYNVENLFARAKALDTNTWAEGHQALEAFDSFNRTAAKKTYSEVDKKQMLHDLVTLRVLIETEDGVRVNKKQFDNAWALLRENRGDFLVAPKDDEPRIVATGRGAWVGWVELTVEPVDETAIRMTAQVIKDVKADILCVVEAENRPSLVRFNEDLLGKQYGHAMLVDGNDLRGIDVGLFCTSKIDIRWVRSHADLPDQANPKRRLFSRDCPVYQLRLPSGTDLYVLPNHLKSQSFSSGNPDPLRTRQAEAIIDIYNELRDEGAEYIAVLGDLNKGPSKANPDDPPPTLEALLGRRSPLVNAYDLEQVKGIFDKKDKDEERPGTFQSCSLPNRLDYLLMSPELADTVTAGGIFRKGLWGDPGNINPPKLWNIYPDITESRHAASDHAAVWVDLDL